MQTHKLGCVDSNSRNYLRTALLALTVAFALAACGGGGDNKSIEAPKPATPLIPASSGAPLQPLLRISSYGVKSYTFTWEPVVGATSYKLYEDADGAGPQPESLLSEVNHTSVTHTLSALLHKRLNARYRMEACNNAGCTSSAVVTPALNKAIGYIKASNTGQYAEFGYTVALSRDGKTLVVGAPGESSNATGVNGDQGNSSKKESGAVYVFSKNGENWAQQAYIKASNTESNALFGYALALSSDGDTLAVAALEVSNAQSINDKQGNKGLSGGGAVYVFSRSSGSWGQQAYVKGNNTQEGDFFAFSLALSNDGDFLVVGAPHERSNATGVNGDPNDNSAPASGAAYFFIRNNGKWTQKSYIKANDSRALIYFGRGVAITGDRLRGFKLAVAAAADSPGLDNNAVYLYNIDSSHYAPAQDDKISVQSNLRISGTQVSLAFASHGRILAVGAPRNNSAAKGVFSMEQTDSGAEDSGAVYMYEDSGSGMELKAFIKASNAEANDSFGRSVALSEDGETLAISAVREESNAKGINGDQDSNVAAYTGAAYVFEKSAKNWVQKAYLKGSNTDAGDNFGVDIALSGDGNTLAIGAITEASNAIGVGGDQTDNSVKNAGAVYLY